MTSLNYGKERNISFILSGKISFSEGDAKNVCGLIFNSMFAIMTEEICNLEIN